MTNTEHTWCANCASDSMPVYMCDCTASYSAHFKYPYCIVTHILNFQLQFESKLFIILLFTCCNNATNFNSVYNLLKCYKMRTERVQK